MKSGIATDASQSAVWKRLVSGRRVREVIDMVNQETTGKRVFPAVAAVERFTVLYLGPPQDGDLRASMLNFGVQEATVAAARPWTRAELRTFAPRTQTLPSTGDPAEIVLALELQDRFPTLDFADADGANPWNLKYASLFHSSGAKAKGLLHRGPALESEGFTLGKDKRYGHPDGSVALPVYEGQMANRWDHRARTFEGFTGKNRYGRKPHIPWTSEEQHADPGFEVEPRYWMHEEDANTRLDDIVGPGPERVMMGFRDVGAVWTNRRIMRVAAMPRVPATHKLPVLVTDRDTLFSALALLNSMTFDFLVRIRVSGGSLPASTLGQCAAPLPREIPVDAESIAERLSVTSTVLADQLGAQTRPWDSRKRELLDAQADALVASAYGLTTAEYETVLDHFKLLEKIETREVGEYRSKRLRLEAFEQIGGGR